MKPLAIMRSKVLLAAQAVAICGVIAVLAWSKSRPVTGHLPGHVEKKLAITFICPA